MSVKVGTAAWAIPRALTGAFAASGSVLERYSARFDAVEINSTFYRSHRRSTYQRWAACTPPDFRFSAKVPRAITHDLRLRDAAAPLAAFASEIGGLGEKLGPILVQLPPSLAFDPATSAQFFSFLRTLIPGSIVCEPRHSSWFDQEAATLLIAHRISLAAVDPTSHPAATNPGGWSGLAYWRLHGSPRIYYSNYPTDVLVELATTLSCSGAGETWCIFDNTALGFATANALTMLDIVAAE